MSALVGGGAGAERVRLPQSVPPPHLPPPPPPPPPRPVTLPWPPVTPRSYPLERTEPPGTQRVADLATPGNPLAPPLALRCPLHRSH